MADLPTLYKWQIRPSTGRMTITHSTGKVTGVTFIYTATDGRLIATTFTGQAYALSISADTTSLVR